MSTNEIIIDAVFTWVDGQEASHKQKIEKYIVDKNVVNNKSIKMRYHQVNEIEFAVKSILKYATFVRNIFIVTDNQIPNFLRNSSNVEKEFSNVHIVDHKTIFEGHEEFLPTFNSRSIETLLYKIPNLSEHFIYLNDDMFLLNETKPSDFFKNRFPVLRGKWIDIEDTILKSIAKQTKTEDSLLHRKGKEMGAKLIGFDKLFNIHHTPYPLRKSTIKKYFENHNNLLLENIKYKFRNENQFLPQVLANHIELKNNTSFQEKSIAIVYIHSYTLFKISKKFFRATYDKKRLFMCLQNLDQCSRWKLSFIKNWLHKKYN